MRGLRRKGVVAGIAFASVVANLAAGNACAVSELDDAGKLCTETCPSGLPCIQGLCGGASRDGAAQSNGDATAQTPNGDASKVDPPVRDGGGGGGDADSSIPIDGSGSPAKLRVFVSSAAVPPNQVQGVCAAAVAAAKLGRTFIPWLHDANASVKTRIGAGPYYLIGSDQVLVTNDPATGLVHAIDRTEDGGSPGSNTEVWTGLNPDGAAFQQNCGDWTSVDGTYYGGLGSWQKVTGGWTADHGGSCVTGLPAHVYCFEGR